MTDSSNDSKSSGPGIGHYLILEFFVFLSAR